MNEKVVELADDEETHARWRRRRYTNNFLLSWSVGEEAEAVRRRRWVRDGRANNGGGGVPLSDRDGRYYYSIDLSFLFSSVSFFLALLSSRTN